MKTETTITLPKKEYDDLIQFKEAYEKNRVLFEYDATTYGYSEKHIFTKEKDHAFQFLCNRIDFLQTENEILKKRKWWQLLF